MPMHGQLADALCAFPDRAQIERIKFVTV